jgi:endonuclease III
MNRRERAGAVAEILAGLYPDAHCLLEYGGVPWKLLLSTILSAQTTDESVNRTTPKLWKAFPDLPSLASAPTERLEEIIHPLGFFRSKTKSLKGAAEWLLANSGGDVPDVMDRLLEIPGVGRKTANVLLGTVYGKPAIIVDTHVRRLSCRMGFTNSDDPDRIESDLEKLIPPAGRTAFSHRMGFHGRRVCTARSPKCPSCPILDICPRKGL